jgi:hypothetical protein
LNILFYLKVSFNPIDSSQILITGNHIFQRYRLNNGHFSTHDQEEFERYQSMNITCHCWLNENDILLGFKTGFICTVNKYGDILQQYNVYADSLSKLYNSSNGLSSDLTSIRSISDINIKNKKKISKKRFNSQFSSRLIFNKSPLSKIDIEQNEREQRSSSRSFDDNRQMINDNDIICLLSFSRGVFVSTG